MEHEGKALAADELDGHHHHAPGVASVHIRAVVTWVAIFPLVALGMTLMGAFAGEWPPVLRALLLTAIVVPATVYLIVPRLLLAYGRLARSSRRH